MQWFTGKHCYAYGRIEHLLGDNDNSCGGIWAKFTII